LLTRKGSQVRWPHGHGTVSACQLLRITSPQGLKLQPSTQTIVISLRTTFTIFESPMSQPVHEPINMAEIPGVGSRTGAIPALRYHGDPINFIDTMYRSPTSVRAKPPTARRIRICGWIRSTLFDVLAAGWRRGQEDDGELERRCRWYSHLCKSSLCERTFIRIDPET